MNINKLSTSIFQYKNIINKTTNPFVKSNLMPLTADTISFGAKNKINDVNINQAKKRIAEFQDPDFNPGGQHNLPVGDLLNVCKYCGCTIETDGGNHQYHIRTPLGQSHPIGWHSSIKNTSKAADPGMVKDIVQAVRNLDANDGELIFNQEREDVVVTKDSTVSHTEQRNYYKEELLARREEERKIKEAQETIEQAKQDKISEKEKNEIRAIISEIRNRINILETTKESYQNLYESAMELIENELASFAQTETLEQDKENIRKTIEAQLEFSTNDKTAKIDTILKENEYSDNESKETLQAKSNKLKESISEVEKEYEVHDKWVSQLIMENPHISHLQKKYKVLIEFETLIRNLQIDRRNFKEMTKESGTEKKYEAVSKSLSQKKKELLELKTAFIKNEISIEDAKRIAKNISDSTEIEFLEFLDAHKTDEIMAATQKEDSKVDWDKENLISKIEFYLESRLNRLAEVYKLLEVIKPNCGETKYQELKKKADTISSKINNGMMKKNLVKLQNLQNKQLSPYIRAKRENAAKEEYKSITKSLYILSAEIIELLPEEERESATFANEADAYQFKLNFSTERQVDIFGNQISSETSDIADKTSDIQTADENSEFSEAVVISKAEEVESTKIAKEGRAEVPENIFNISSSKMSEHTDTEHKVTEASETTLQTKPTEAESDYLNERNYFANGLINKIAKRIAMLNMHPLIEDLKAEVKELISEIEIDELHKATADRYWVIMSNKLNSISKDKYVKELKRARTFAVLKDIELSKPDVAEQIYKKPIYEINNAITIIAETGEYNGYKPKMKDLNTIYTTYNKFPQNTEKTAKFLAECFNLNEKEKKNLAKLLEGNLSYINEITSPLASKNFRTLIIKNVMSDYDKKYQTNYSAKANNAIANRENKKLSEEKIKMLDNFEWNSDPLF